MVSTPKRILLVDDSAIIRASTGAALSRAGFDVTVRAAFDELPASRAST
jgi:PleD family two-component response regulator